MTLRRLGVVACLAMFVTGSMWADDDVVTNSVKSLTLRECIERALAHNLDIQIERINPTIQDWGVVYQQGTFDPALTGNVSYQDNTQPLNPEQATALGLTTVKQTDLQTQFGLGGKLPSGTEYALTAGDIRDGGTLASNFVYTGSSSIALTQPLLKNFGFSANTASIRIARKGRQIAGQQLILRVTDTVSAVSRAYYELVFAIENHKAKVEDLNQAKALLDENRKRVQIGVLSPLDVTQAEAGVAEREEAVIVAERVIHDNENVIKRLISQDVMELRHESFVPVDYPIAEMVEIDTARSIRTALAKRSEYRQAQYDLERQHILVSYNRNQLWPQIDLQGSYGLNGRSDTGFDDYVSNATSSQNPVWMIGIVVTIPIGNRQARANYNTARLQTQQALLSLKRLEQQIIVEIDDAVQLVQSNLKRVEATRVASRLAEESLKAEQQKLRAGTSTSFLVLQAQAQLASARSAEIRARSDYSESLVDLARSEGTTAEKNNIVLQE